MNDSPQLPEGKVRRPRRSAWRFAWIPISLIAIAATILWRTYCGINRDDAMDDLRRINLSLQEFDAEYGQFPDKATAGRVKETTGTALTLGDGSSNQLFRQLFAFGIKSEDMFWMWTPDAKWRPDNVYQTDAKALQPGECSYAYIAGLSSRSPSGTPMLMTPLIRGTTTFDPRPFLGKAIVLFLNESIQLLPIDKNGHVMINGKDLFDPSQPFWHGKKPDLKWQE